MIATGNWRTHLSAADLAKRWGLSRHVVQDYATKAAILLKIGKERREELQAMHAQFLEQVMFDAREAKSLVTGIPDWRHVLLAWELNQKYVLGNYARPESDGPNVADLSHEDLQKLAADAFKYIAKQVGPAGGEKSNDKQAAGD